MTSLKTINVTAGWRNNHPVIFFVILFAVMMTAFYMFYFATAVQEKFFTPLVDVYASISGGLLNLMGYKTSVTGYTISSSQFSVGVKIGCDAVEPMALFAAGILAFPAAFRKKIKGLLTGLAVLFVLNVVRICTLFIVGLHSASLFETMHMVVWQIGFILVAGGLWIAWLQRATKPRLS